MPRKPAGKTVRIELPPDDESEKSPTTTPEQEDAEAVFSQLPEGTVAKIYRIQEDGSPAFVTTMAPNAVSEERIAALGAGKYIVRLWGPLGDGTNRRGYKGQRQVLIAESSAQAAVAAQASASPVAAGASMFDQMMMSMVLQQMKQMQDTTAMQAQMQREHSAALLTLMQQATNKQTDPLLATILTTLLEKKADPIEEARRIAELANVGKGTAKGGASELVAMMDLLDRLKERASSEGGSDGKGTSWKDLIREALPILQAQQGQTPPPMPIPATPPAGGAYDPARQGTAFDPGAFGHERQGRALSGPVAGPGIESSPPPEGMSEMTPAIRALAPYIPELERGARNKVDAGVAADWVAQNLPEGLADFAAQALDRPDFISDFLTAYPQFVPFTAWVDDVRRELLDALRDDGDNGDGDDGDDSGG